MHYWTGGLARLGELWVCAFGTGETARVFLVLEVCICSLPWRPPSTQQHALAVGTRTHHTSLFIHYLFAGPTSNRFVPSSSSSRHLLRLLLGVSTDLRTNHLLQISCPFLIPLFLYFPLHSILLDFLDFLGCDILLPILVCLGSGGCKYIVPLDILVRHLIKLTSTTEQGLRRHKESESFHKGKPGKYVGVTNFDSAESIHRSPSQSVFRTSPPLHLCLCHRP
jgi:hypothetical protein